MLQQTSIKELSADKLYSQCTEKLTENVLICNRKSKIKLLLEAVIVFYHVPEHVPHPNCKFLDHVGKYYEAEASQYLHLKYFKEKSFINYWPYKQDIWETSKATRKLSTRAYIVL